MLQRFLNIVMGLLSGVLLSPQQAKYVWWIVRETGTTSTSICLGAQVGK